MTKNEYYQDYHDLFEYHGNTTIEFVRKKYDVIIKRDWILFDSIEEAADYFNDTGGVC